MKSNIKKAVSFENSEVKEVSKITDEECLRILNDPRVSQ
tara:strand:- start:307 stop:423 length:117 start_codon:yes stop_codon:yes gene_type:complete